MQSQGLTLPLEPEVGPSATRVSTKDCCVDPSGNDLGMGGLEKCGLYVKENPSRQVALGRIYEGLTTIHNISLRNDQVKVGVEEVRDADAPIHVPTQEGPVRPAKPADRPDYDVDDPIYLMTWIIPQLFLKPLQVTWDATVFGLFNENFPLHIKHKDLSEIGYDGQYLSISVILCGFCKSLYIMVYYLTYCFKFIHNLLYFNNNRHMTETSMRVGNSDVYGFLEPQSIQRFGQLQFESESYINNWI
ncbi:hypothetical protein GmHk_07G019810 [Glycine max]|nr:hypothetical protein GmHk_07G019810 [Glycine max]